MAHSPLFRKFSRLIRSAANSDLSRRNFIVQSSKVAAVLAATTAYPQGLKAKGLFKTKYASNEPVIVIGGGVAGLTAAYRLTQAGHPCEVFEASSRIGGRMYTKQNFNSDGMFCELGGEFVDLDHEDLANLCAELHLELEAYKEDESKTHHELFYSNGQLYSEAQLAENFAPLAKHIKSDIDKIFGSQPLDAPTYKNHYNALKYDQISLHTYLYSMKDVEKWVLDVVNAIYLTEYGIDTEEQSALNLILLISSDENNAKTMGGSDMGRRIKGGSSMLPDMLKLVLEKTIPIHLDHKLVRIVDQDGSLKLTFSSNSKSIEVKASKVICALPFSTLRNVENIFNLDLNPHKKQCIKEFGYGTSSKIILGFNERSWRKNPTIENKNSNGSVWSNSKSLQFWEQSREQKGTQAILCNYTGGKIGKNISESSVQSTLQTLNKIFPGTSKTYNQKSLVINWSKMPHHLGSYSCPKIGQYTTLNGAQASPELNNRLFFAGEHTSPVYGGYMNGAVESGNRVAKEIL